MESPEDAGRLFGIDDKLTHSARLVENETLNKRFFGSFMDGFLDMHGEDYGDWAIIGSKYPLEVYRIINRLMSRGIYPIRTGWFGGNAGDELYGDVNGLLDGMMSSNILSGRKKSTDMAKAYNEMVRGVNDYDPLPGTEPLEVLPVEYLKQAADDDRRGLIRFIHDVYWHYIRRCISQDRLTFGINAMLAFSILYENGDVRRANSFDYVMIDEFQDTNAAQLMLSLMILNKPNLCVVGDWKQGIYGFRFVSVDNILDFEQRAVMFRKILNDDNERVSFRIPEPISLELDTNYRSSQRIINESFRCLTVRGSKDEVLDVGRIESHIVRLTGKRDSDIGENTAVRYVRVDSKDGEAEAVSRCIREYVGSGKYLVTEGDGSARPMVLGDIAVLCRTGNGCRAVVDRLTKDGISAYLQGDVELMCTREGKLALAWLRYINNSRDPWGYIPIMADRGYTMAECERARGSDTDIPLDIREQRSSLYAKRRRVTELLTSIFAWYGIDNDISQTIINILSSQHRGSLLTISDLITMIEDDITSSPKTAYPVETDLDSDAVKVMTMHRAKGLEFPVVIVPYIDLMIMPSTTGDSSKLTFDELRGIRCSKVVGHYDGYSKICDSWRTKLTRVAVESDYDEERRLMFVALSRAKQYVTVISGPKPSQFMKDLSGENYEDIEDCELPATSAESMRIEKPTVPDYRARTPTFGVHSIMRLEFEDGMGGNEGSDEICGKGKEYGTEVHLEAQMMHCGCPPSGRYLESAYIAENVLSRTSLPGFLKSYAEIDCTLPVCDGRYILKGTVDLLMVFEDRIEIHDYKTDVTDRFRGEYELQLSVYARAAEAYYKGLPVRCFIDYVSQGRSFEFDPYPMERIDERAADEIPRLQDEFAS